MRNAVFSFLLLINISLIHTVDYTCTSGQDCSIVFNTYQSAYQSTITCPTNYACHITCVDPTTSTNSNQICQEATIIASSSTTIKINCNGLENCKNLNFIGSSSNTGNITINCDGINTCNMAEFDFKSSSYISINCTSDGGCNSATFYGISTYEMYIQFNTINSGDYSTVYCGSICSIYSAYAQSNVMVYSNNMLYGDILQCDDSESNCFIDSKMLCDDNYTQTCDIDFVNNQFICDQCLNHLFTQYELETTMNYMTAQGDTIQYRQRTQYAFYSSVIYLLSDITDQFRKPIEEECNCIDEIDEHINILITNQFTELKETTYELNIIITTDLEVIYIELTNIFNDGRFAYLLTVNMALFDNSFEVNSIDLPSDGKRYTYDKQIIGWFTIVIVCISAIVLIIAIIGTIQMYAYDVTIYVTGILLFGLYSWDFYSDILFSYEVWIGYAIATENKDAFLVLFIACLIFLILPIIASILSLFRFQDKWKNDVSIGDRVTGWNRDWSTYLLILTILSGSSFAAVNILNSRVFGHPLFCMGLSYRHLKKFENQRLWGVILSENIPQVIVQGIYFYYSLQKFSSILLLAFISSLLSIIVALIDIYNNKRLFGQFNKQDDYQTILKVPVISHEVAGKQWRLALATHRFNEVFSKIIGVDKYAIEVDLPSPNQNGLVINFSVRTVDISPKEIVDKMTRAQRNGAMAKFIQEAWDLEKQPLLGRFKFDQVGRKKTDIVVDTAIEMVNPLSTDGKKLVIDDDINVLSFNHRDSSISSERHRTNTVDVKPYEDLDTTTKHKVKIKKKNKRSQTASAIPENVGTIPENIEVNVVRKMRIESETNMDSKEDDITILSPHMSQSDIPENIPQTQTKLAGNSRSESSLPRQPTGAHTKQMREMVQEFNTGVEMSSKITRKEISPLSPIGKTIKHIMDNNPQAQFRKQTQQGARNNNMSNVQNGPNYAQSTTNLNEYNTQNDMQQQYDQMMGYNSQNNYGHGHAQTYGQVPYTYQQTHQVPSNNTIMQQQQSFSSQNNNNMQQQWQQNYGGYAASAFNLNQGNYQQQPQQQQQQLNYQQQFQQNPQMYSASTTNVQQGNYNNINNYNIEEEKEIDHVGFVPPAPQQEVGKYIEYRQKRQMIDEEKKLRNQKEKEKKKLRKEKEKEMKRLENISPNNNNNVNYNYGNNFNNNKHAQSDNGVGNYNQYRE